MMTESKDKKGALTSLTSRGRGGVWFVMGVALLIMATPLVWWGHRVFNTWQRHDKERRVWRRIYDHLTGQTRRAQVIVTKREEDPVRRTVRTTIKFLEFDANRRAMKPRTFTFEGDLIQFQSLVVRMPPPPMDRQPQEEIKSAAVFWKAFVLNGERTQEHIITPLIGTPEGFRLQGFEQRDLEDAIWNKFWRIALEADERAASGVRHAQVEAPGMRFLPGYLYTIYLENNGGLRIDAEPLPEILRDEIIPLQSNKRYEHP